MLRVQDIINYAHKRSFPITIYIIMSKYTTQNWYLPQNQPKPGLVAYVNARLFDPATGLDALGALITEGDKIVDFGAELSGGNVPEGSKIIDCGGHLLCPGLIDIQVHFREPGQTNKETLESGSKSAASGGITTVVCQPNTKPVIDDVVQIEFLKSRARETAYININTYAAISKNMAGNELSDMGKLVEAGAVGFTDDGLPVMNSLLMRRALTYSSMFNVPIAQHAEDLQLSQGGCMNEGEVSFALGVTGIPNISESVMVERDIAILALTGGHYHVLHVSTKEALASIRRGKEQGLHITCEVAPHHFTLTDKALLGFNTNAKMNPPLRSEEDRAALVAALQDGTIDAIATDHAPHDAASKNVPLATATFGIVGVETMLPLSLALYHQGLLNLKDLMAKFTCNAADIISKPSGRIKKGAIADLTLIDLDHEWVIDINKFASKSNNSPFHGHEVKGRAIKTIVAGKMVYECS